MTPTTVSALRKPSNHEIPELGTVTVTLITFGMYAEADKLANEALEDERARVFTRSILGSLVTDPPMTSDKIADLSPEALDALVLVAADSSGVRDDYDRTSPELPAAERLYQAFNLRQEEVLKSVSSSIKGIYDQLSEASATASKLFTGIGLQAVEQAKAINHALDIQRKMIPVEALGVLPNLQEKFSAFNSLSQVIGDKAALRDSVVLDAARAAAKIQLPDLTKQFAAINLPEPLLSDSLIASGLNAPFMHSPTYALPDIRPVQDEKEFRVRASETKRRRLVDAYDILSSLEQAIRNLIEENLRELHGDHWWKRGIPDTIRRQCEERKQQKEKTGEPVYDPLSYAYFDDYRAIITKGDSWKNSFESVFGDKAEFEVCMKWVGRVRDPIAHSRTITGPDYSTFVTAANVLQRAIRRSKRNAS